MGALFAPIFNAIAKVVGERSINDAKQECQQALWDYDARVALALGRMR